MPLSGALEIPSPLTQEAFQEAVDHLHAELHRVAAEVASIPAPTGDPSNPTSADTTISSVVVALANQLTQVQATVQDLSDQISAVALTLATVTRPSLVPPESAFNVLPQVPFQPLGFLVIVAPPGTRFGSIRLLSAGAGPIAPVYRTHSTAEQFLNPAYGCIPNPYSTASPGYWSPNGTELQAVVRQFSPPTPEWTGLIDVDPLTGPILAEGEVCLSVLCPQSPDVAAIYLPDCGQEGFRNASCQVMLFFVSNEPSYFTSSYSRQVFVPDTSFPEVLLLGQRPTAA